MSLSDNQRFLLFSPLDDSIQKIGYFGNLNEHLYLLSHMETLSLFSWNDAQVIRKYGDIRNSSFDFSLEYGINMFYHSEHLFLAAGDRTGNIGLLNINMDGLSLAYTLNGGHKSEIVRDVLWNAEDGFLLSACEDGTLAVWKN